MPRTDATRLYAAALLPPDDAWRTELHNEMHARPPARIRLPALVVTIAVLNHGVSREQECAHLQKLPGQAGLRPEELQSNFLRLRFDDHTLKWERHTEFTRYAFVQPLPPDAQLGAEEPPLAAMHVVPPEWLRAVPGHTIAAQQVAMVEHGLQAPEATLALAQRWFGGATVAASLMGRGHSMVVTDFCLRTDGFERMLVLAPPGTTDTRVGRISQRLTEVEIYRMMALRGLPVAKAMGPVLAQCESALAAITAQLETRSASESALLDQLIHVAARVERSTAEHQYRFSATEAYDALVRQRLGELREVPIPGTQTLAEFMQRRLSPAIATVGSTARRLGALSQRIERTSALLRTRVDIATETQNQQLLAKLQRGQALQLRLQSTVEGLSIAAISYYVVSLLLYGGKAMKAVGVPIQPELAAGAAIPLVLWAVWKATQRIHRKLHAGEEGGGH